MRFVFALILFVHGFAHLVGFVVPWRVATLPQMPYKTTVLGDSINIGHFGIRAVGVVWLAAALAFAACGIALLARQPWWLPATIWVTVFSLALCGIGWPDSRIGILVDVAILLALWIGWRYAASHALGL
jgi:hypothetical protein